MKKSIAFRMVAGLLLAVLLCGCAGMDRNSALDSARASGFREQRLVTPFFTLYGLLRPARDNQGSDVLRVYVEGDGHAWATRHRPSSDPTPRRATALRLALNDPSGDAVLYLARPCQYVKGGDARHCETRYWTSARLAPEVVSSLSEAVTEVAQRCGAKRIVLIGYSGGGGAAALMAAQRKDVIFLGTIAGALDTYGWTRRLELTPLNESLNPLDVAYRLKDLPQRHLSSSNDDIVPPEISAGFCRAVEIPTACVVVREPSHTDHWEKFWDYSLPAEALARQPDLREERSPREAKPLNYVP